MLKYTLVSAVHDSRSGFLVVLWEPFLLASLPELDTFTAIFEFSKLKIKNVHPDWLIEQGYHLHDVSDLSPWVLSPRSESGIILYQRDLFS